MAAGEHDNKQNELMGFAGLSSLVSDVDTTPPPPAPKKEPANSAASAARPVPPPTQPQPRQTHQRPTQSSPASSGGKWVLGIVAVIGVFWLIGQSNQPATTSPSSAYSPPVQNAAPSYSPPVQSVTPSFPSPAPPPVPSRPTEAKPQVGQNLVLSREQIHYCLAEEIRMIGAKAAVNNYSDSDVDRFNAMVADYNSRCGSFRYHSGALETARRDIEPYRSELQIEGGSRFVRSSTSSVAPHATVKAIQQKLNELGYSAGATDGLMGKRTRAAIMAFQRDRGLTATGVADQALLLQLQRAPARPSGSRGGNDPVVQGAPARSTTTASLAAPPFSNAQRAGPPANSWVYGSSWYCNDGYKKVGDKCEALNVPANAWVYGSSWYCNDGYRKVGDRCEALNVPANAWVYGSNWHCNDGYKKAGDKCVSIFER